MTKLPDFKEARRTGARAYGHVQHEQFLGWTAILGGFLGLVALFCLVMGVSTDGQSIYIWQGLPDFHSSGHLQWLLRLLEYVLSYAFVWGLVSTILYNTCHESMGVKMNLTCSFWFLYTACLLGPSVTKGIQVFIDTIPQGILGWVVVVPWALGGIIVIKILFISRQLKADDRNVT